MKNFLKLPQAEIFFSGLHDEEILLAAGGKPPAGFWFKEVAADKKIWAIDKGLEICQNCGILPEFLIGDFDSAKNSSVRQAENAGIKIERQPVEKDFTDTELALIRAEECGKDFAVLTGAFGGRADHFYNLLFVCAAANLKICIADEREILFFITGKDFAEVNFFQKPLAVSLLPIDEICGGVNLTGVRWELHDKKIFRNKSLSISNRPTSDKIKISVATGTLAVYFCFAEN